MKRFPHNSAVVACTLFACALTLACSDSASSGLLVDSVETDAGADIATSDTVADAVPDTVADTVEDTVADIVADTTAPDTVADTVPETVADTVEDTVADTAPDTVEDTVADTVEDTVADTVAETTTPIGCSAAPFCPETFDGPTGIALTMIDNMAAPTLGGLVDGPTPPSGVYDLSIVDVYVQGAFLFAGLVTITDNGGTQGTANFDGDAWALRLALDMSMNTPLGAQVASQTIEGGGCYSVAGNQLDSDLSFCAVGWPADAEIPTSAEFEFDSMTGEVKIKLVLTKEFILSLVPADQQGTVSALLTGPITLVVTTQESTL